MARPGKAVHLGLHLARMRGEQQNPASDLDGFRNRVRDEQHRESGVVPELQQLILHFAARERVERRKRLVHQENVGLHRHAAGNGNALLHAAGKRVRKAVRELGEVDLVDVFERLVLGCSPLELAARGQREHHVLLHRLPRQELIELLEDHHPVGPGPGHLLALEPDLSLDRGHIAADGLEQRRLAAARRPEKYEAVRSQHLKVHAIGGRDQMVLGLVLQSHTLHVEQGSLGLHRACLLRRGRASDARSVRHLF